MKKLIICSIIAIAATLSVQAQCDKKLVLNASKAVFLSPDSVEERVETATILIEITKTSIFINPGDGENDRISGTFKDLLCAWKEPLKNGKVSVEKVEFTNPNGELKTGKFSVIAKDGVVTFWMEIDEMQGRKIRVIADTVKEQ